MKREKCKRSQRFLNKFTYLNHLSIQALNKLIYGFQISKF